MGTKVQNSPRSAATNPTIVNRRIFRQETSITLGLTSGADVYTLGSAFINLRALNAFNEAAAGYDLYKLQNVKVYALPMGPTGSGSSVQQQPLYTTPNTVFWSYVDPAYESTVGTTQQTVINATNTQWKTLSINNQTMVAKWKPNVTQAIGAEPVINALVRPRSTWVNTQTDIIRWNALKFYVVLAGGADLFPTTVIRPRVRIIVEYDVDFKIPRANITLPTLSGPVCFPGDCDDETPSKRSLLGDGPEHLRIDEEEVVALCD